MRDDGEDADGTETLQNEEEVECRVSSMLQASLNDAVRGRKRIKEKEGEREREGAGGKQRGSRQIKGRLIKTVNPAFTLCPLQ